MTLLQNNSVYKGTIISQIQYSNRYVRNLAVSFNEQANQSNLSCKDSNRNVTDNSLSTEHNYNSGNKTNVLDLFQTVDIPGDSWITHNNQMENFSKGSLNTYNNQMGNFSNGAMNTYNNQMGNFSNGAMNTYNNQMGNFSNGTMNTYNNQMGNFSNGAMNTYNNQMGNFSNGAMNTYNNQMGNFSNGAMNTYNNQMGNFSNGAMNTYNNQMGNFSNSVMNTYNNQKDSSSEDASYTSNNKKKYSNSLYKTSENRNPKGSKYYEKLSEKELQKEIENLSEYVHIRDMFNIYNRLVSIEKDKFHNMLKDLSNYWEDLARTINLMGNYKTRIWLKVYRDMLYELYNTEQQSFQILTLSIEDEKFLSFMFTETINSIKSLWESFTNNTECHWKEYLSKNASY
ncbi:phist protein [Plasmodium malariae]|uniref:Phist protein n=1 Tax=Plasmodium malariae TaxID=5858 RepID=A0A1A8X923_PLAMA|nr:phist protein [Plasmodium malariae]